MSQPPPDTAPPGSWRALLGSPRLALFAIFGVAVAALLQARNVWALPLGLLLATASWLVTYGVAVFALGRVPRPASVRRKHVDAAIAANLLVLTAMLACLAAALG